MATETTPVVPIEPEKLIEALHALTRQIPEYAQMDISDAASVRGVANLDEAFVEGAINAAGASEVIRTAIGMTAEEMRSERLDASRWGEVEALLRAMLLGVASTNLRRKYRVGLACLQAYNISRQLIRNKDEHPNLVAHVQTMKQRNRFGRKRQPAAQPVPSPVPKQKT